MPVTPEEARDNKINTIPAEVFEAFDELITKNLRGSRAFILQRNIVDLIKSKIPDDMVFDYDWLSVESIYRQKGWKVVYDKPGHNESYPAIFEFIVDK
jgi:hypothetical protein